MDGWNLLWQVGNRFIHSPAEWWAQSWGAVRHRPLVATYCEDNFQVVQHVNLFGETFAAPANQVILTAQRKKRCIIWIPV